jgi:hypothetical protein
MTTGKSCSICKVYFERIDTNFYKHKQYYNSYCKSCHSSKTKEFAQKNVEKRKLYSKKSIEKEASVRRKRIDEARKKALESEFKYCKYCNTTKSKGCFSLLKSSIDGFRNQCSDCRRLKQKKTKKPYHLVWKNKLLASAKKNSKLIGIACEIDLQYIEFLYNSQKGKCFWSGVPLLLVDDPKHPQKPSLDRLDNSKGYQKDNVVLTCFSMNFARNVNDFDTFSNFIKILKETIKNEP